ncbi:hypothetical protein, partial [Clostridium luticellarii]|uniref:hypothetical protein n=1 Tax=Clostridium luticellarii TaxID=1691940 RepID=UPI001A9A310A
NNVSEIVKNIKINLILTSYAHTYQQLWISIILFKVINRPLFIISKPNNLFKKLSTKYLFKAYSY